MLTRLNLLLVFLIGIILCFGACDKPPKMKIPKLRKPKITSSRVKGQLRKKSRAATKNMGGGVPLESRKVIRGIEVIGSEPSWMLAEAAYEDYPYNLLTTLITGEYDLNLKTGYPRSKEALNAPMKYPIIAKAREINPSIKIFTLVTAYGDFGGVRMQQKGMDDFLDNRPIQELFKDSIFSLLTNENYLGNGLVLDLPAVKYESRNKLVQFVKFLAESELSNGFICIKLPAIDKDKIYKKTIKALSPYIDFFILKAYDFQHDLPTPIAPVFSQAEKDVNSSVAYYYDAGLPMEKLIVELPYFGEVWQGTGNAYVRDNVRPTMPYYEIMEKVKKETILYDEAKDGAYVVLKNGKQYRFDDSLTLSRKYDWLMDSVGVKGVGIWALGYNKFDDDKKLWKALANSFATSPKSPMFPLLGYLLLFISGGFIYSIIGYWQVRNALARDLWKRIIHFVVATIMAILFMWTVEIIPHTEFGKWGATGMVASLLAILGFRAIYSQIRRWL